jgi:L-ribulose-5-phosphate 3-epimerase
MLLILKPHSLALLVCVGLFLSACNNDAKTDEGSNSTVSTVDPAKDWKFGIALWTFHDVNFPEALNRVDSVGLKYIEPNTFHSAGPELKDTVIMRLSSAGIEKLKALIAQKGLICESMYVVGDTTLSSWVKQFDIAKQFGV